MKDFTTSTSTLWVLLFLLHALGCHAAKTQLALSAGNSYMNFRFDVAQRCNSLDSCYSGRGSYASWLALKDSTRIAFYALALTRVYSFMLWEIGTYPIIGFFDICHGRENARLNATNATETQLVADGSGFRRCWGQLNVEHFG
ncbi:hypothetical protein PC129_g1106 [Phytophthora cactorum]|uniref:Uncharacterized protein n=1 Tax=Phytophthora cactorum TaxID=29920 RepID=A0A8T1ITF0_9STRA|nr:hypothetical protein PC112_g2160 [Phytophthora cactorum]KAG2845330.1 hypothetical protein PC111_g1639 [Phytophthora cactorum]KAG2930490.1 hypothetical protein PC114_g2429 [Phytophthora cactorum]KAG3006024.1 hypothetical protein PC120_g17626 [Phytophthora cactorum]KAG3103267.1 hypothetical protein PC122_g1886 [Phytophthora cactorum]